ncbi:juvenile hormone esterase-like [Schistocerca gregaria]|uniref:juvenile hormone esterase-like n=1 Tax=Schistocerca gregaria TaxID=7010 RepID=UPI00211E8265|nr:juvenile hormone esterase-like [Schistocerca gregaria]
MRPTSLLALAVVVSASAVSASVIRPQTRQLEYAVATTENGVVRGEVVTSLNGTPYKRFLGIPYATPPTGDLRFKAPLPAANWTGVRDALTFGPSCSQSGRGSEDCLHMNVFVPQTDDDSPLPVMFNIYGGGFTAGSSDGRPPDYFVENGVLLVTFNYRLGPQGFLSLQNDDIPGNAGLKDQLLALQWVQRNIAAFGGDPTKVTIFGESAGGASSSFMFLSPKAEGLFRAAVMESGVASAQWAVQPSPRDIAYRLGAALGFQQQGDNATLDDQRLAAFLRAADPEDLSTTQIEASPGTIAFAPVVEQPSDSAVITELPEVSLNEGRYNRVPFMLGVTSGEACLFAYVLRFMNVSEVSETFVQSVAERLPLPTEEERIEAAKRVEEFYFGAEGFSVNKSQAISDVYSDIMFIQPAYAFARSAVNTRSLPVYFYYFDYDGWGSTEYGMIHVMEVAYLFPVANGPDKDPASNDGKVSQQLTTLWTNFGKYGEPTPEGSTMTWDRFTADTDSYMDMKLEFVSRQHFLEERMAFWRDLLHF